jgi:hypothetical protein
MEVWWDGLPFTVIPQIGRWVDAPTSISMEIIMISAIIFATHELMFIISLRNKLAIWIISVDTHIDLGQISACDCHLTAEMARPVP